MLHFEWPNFDVFQFGILAIRSYAFVGGLRSASIEALCNGFHCIRDKLDSFRNVVRQPLGKVRSFIEIRPEGPIGGRI